MKSRLPDGSTMESTYIATLQIPDLSKIARHTHIFLKMHTAPFISLGFLCNDGCTITLDKQSNDHPEEWRRNNQRDHKQEYRNVGSAPGAQQSENVVNNIMEKTSKPELAEYLYAALFIPTTVSLLKARKQGFMKTWTGLI